MKRIIKIVMAFVAIALCIFEMASNAFNDFLHEKNAISPILPIVMIFISAINVCSKSKKFRIVSRIVCFCSVVALGVCISSFINPISDILRLIFGAMFFAVITVFLVHSIDEIKAQKE